MRIVIVGAGSLATLTARLLLERRNEVIIIERNRERIEELSEILDCGFIEGGGSKPAILREADPRKSDLLLCLSDNDQDNIIAGLLGKSLGFAKVAVRIEDAEYEHICIELGLTGTMVPDRAIARLLVDLAEDRDPLELSGVMKAGVRFFHFVAREEHEGPLSALELPGKTRVVLLYRDAEYLPADPDRKIRRDDEIVLVTLWDSVQELRQRFGRDSG
jgi:trk system potassium uptake protein TrkA